MSTDAFKADNIYLSNFIFAFQARLCQANIMIAIDEQYNWGLLWPNG